MSTTATMSALLFFRLAANMPGCESMPNSSLIVGRLSTIDRRVANGTSCRGRAARGLPRPSCETTPVWYFWRFSDIFLYYIVRLFMVPSMWKSERRNESWSSPRNVVAAVNTCRDISELNVNSSLANSYIVGLWNRSVKVSTFPFVPNVRTNCFLRNIQSMGTFHLAISNIRR